MRARIAAALAATLVACAVAQEKPAVAPTASRDVPPELAGFGWFAELRGACWRGEHPDGKTYDIQCYLAQYDRLIRGSIKIHRGGAPTPSFEGDAVFSVDPQVERKVNFTQWGTGGVYGTGEITFDGEMLVFRNRIPDGSMSDVRSLWRRTPGGFMVTREREVKGKGWDPLLEVRYKRVP